jgi:glycine hydroxymethyltransferase
MIFFRRGPRARGGEYAYEGAINAAVFPALQGGPHNHQVGALAVALRSVMQPSFKLYAQRVRANAAAMGAALTGFGYKLVTGGTDNHLVLWDLRPLGITGSKVEKLCDAVHVTLNKNSVFGDASAISPGGVRVGAPAMTSRGLGTEDFVAIAAFLHRAVQLALALQTTAGTSLKDFVAALEGNEQVAALRADVEAFAGAFPMPGFDASMIGV